VVAGGVVSSASDSKRAQRIGAIPVANLWLLMLYASDLYRELGASRVALEENPDDIPDLVAEILTHQVSRRLRRSPSLGYQQRHAVVTRVRGRIDHLTTTRHRLLDRGQVACRFEEVTADTPRNRLVRSALERMASIVTRPDLAHECRVLAGWLRRMGVVGERPSKSQMSLERLGRNDAADRGMLAAARLAFELALPTESVGAAHMPLPDRDVSFVRRLFEKGVAGYYATVLSEKGWSVRPNALLHWPAEDASSTVEKILPNMRADMILENREEHQRIVIDTKFNALLASGWYRSETLRSGYLYQIYAYLLTQAGSGDQLADSATGILLHPSVGDSYLETVSIQGHRIRFATVDLAGTTANIRGRLVEVIA